MREALTVIGVALVHEDMATVTCGMLVVERGFAIYPAVISLYIGVVTGDLMIYGFGRLARRVKWLRQWLIGNRVERVGTWLDHNMIKVITICKVTSGLLFPTYLAYGWFKISFIRFAVATLIAGMIYTAVAMTLIIFFGETLFRHFGYWIWVFTAAVILLLTFFSARRPNKWSRVVQTVTTAPSKRADLIKEFTIMDAREHRGMPSLKAMTRSVAKAEKIPDVLFYVPIGLRWILLGLKYRSMTLPTAANPCIEGGGYWGESKSDLMHQIGAENQHWVAPFITIERSADPDASGDIAVARAAIHNAGLQFPIVAKPDIGWQGYGVRILHEEEEMDDYIAKYPNEARLILQRYVNYDGEAGVLYIRKPGEKQGRIHSLTLRYFPFVVGDGKSPLRDLILNDPRTQWKSDFYLGMENMHSGVDLEVLNEVPPEGRVVRLAFIGSMRVGGLYRDGSSHITPQMTERFDAIAQSMPEFYYGRFDIRFSSLEQLCQGEGFCIFEINGAGADAIHVWDPERSLRDAYREMFKAQTLLFEVGALNRARGFKPCSLRTFFKLLNHQHQLITQYPPSS